MQPGPLLAAGEVDVGLGPAPRPLVLRPVERRRAHPVLQRQLRRVAHAGAPLLGGVDEEQAAERPPGLAAQRGLRLLVEQDDLASGGGQLGRGHEAGEAGPDDDRVCVHGGRSYLYQNGGRASARRSSAAPSRRTGSPWVTSTRSAPSATSGRNVG